METVLGLLNDAGLVFRKGGGTMMETKTKTKKYSRDRTAIMLHRPYDGVFGTAFAYNHQDQDI